MRIAWPGSVESIGGARAPSTARERSNQWVAVFGGLLALTVALYLPVLHDYFISDDFVLVRFVRTWDGSWLDFMLPWRTYSDPITGSRYKPFFVYLLLLEDLAFGDDVVGRHLVNVVAHACVGMGAFVLARRLTGSSGAALASAVLFLGSRLHSQVVGWTSAFFHVVSVALFVWGLVALHSNSRTRALGFFGVLAAAGLLMDPELVVGAPVVLLLALHHRYLPGGDRSRAGTVAWGALIMFVFTLACAIANLISMQHFPDEGFAFQPRAGRFVLVFLDLFTPFDVPLALKAVTLLVVVGACVVRARTTPLPALMLLAAVPAVLLWSSLGAYAVTPRVLYLPALFAWLAVGQLAGLFLQAVGLRWVVTCVVLLNWLAMCGFDFRLLDVRAQVGAGLRHQQLAARAAGERRVLERPRWLTSADLLYFAPDLEFVDAPSYEPHGFGPPPDFDSSYWPWVWFSSGR